MKPLICLCSLFSAAAVHAVEQTSSSLPHKPGTHFLYDAEYNVAFGPAKQPQLIGRAE